VEWDASPEKIAVLHDAIQPISTDAPLRQVLAEDFPKDCAELPISGGWGYSRDEAIIFLRPSFPRSGPPDFVSLEQHIAQKIIYEELIIFQPREARVWTHNLIQ
jgi:hypothetical protein